MQLRLHGDNLLIKYKIFWSFSATNDQQKIFDFGNYVFTEMVEKRSLLDCLFRWLRPSWRIWSVATPVCWMWPWSGFLMNGYSHFFYFIRGRYNNAIPTWFLALIDCSKIPACCIKCTPRFLALVLNVHVANPHSIILDIISETGREWRNDLIPLHGQLVSFYRH